MRHVANEKQTLAICMRVSPTFNSVVAPILYRTVTLSGSTGLFKHLKPPWYHGPRTTQIKELNLAYITEVDYKVHSAATCSDRWTHRAVLPTSVLRILPRLPIGTGFQECRCARAFLPRKLISPRELSHFWYLCLANTVNTPVDKVVVVSEYFIQDPLSVCGLTAFASQSGALVLVLWSDPQGPGAGTDPTLDLWRHFQADTIAGARSNRDHPMDIVIVNMEQVAGRYLGLTGDPSEWCELISEDHNAKFAQAMDAVTADVVKSGCIPGRHKRSNQIGPTRSTKFIYITMGDYLTTWDWKGELTDQEIKPWLEAIEQDRNGV